MILTTSILVLNGLLLMYVAFRIGQMIFRRGPYHPDNDPRPERKE